MVQRNWGGIALIYPPRQADGRIGEQLDPEESNAVRGCLFKPPFETVGATNLRQPIDSDARQVPVADVECSLKVAFGCVRPLLRRAPGNLLLQ